WMVEPPRGDKVVGNWRETFSTKTVWLVFLQGIPGCVPWGVVGVFLNDYLHVNQGLSVDNATFVLTFFAIGTFLGMVVGAELGQRLYNWRPWAAAAHMAVAEILSAPPLVFMICCLRSFKSLALCAVVSGFFASQTGPIVRACLQNVVAPNGRGLAFAVFALFDDLGKGFGPFVIAKIVATTSRRTAFQLAVLFGWLIGGCVNGLIAFTLEPDERRLAARDGHHFELVQPHDVSESRTSFKQRRSVGEDAARNPLHPTPPSSR
ncbi:MAG: MFS transporter, partial [Pseudomonadota bacterium]